MTPARAQQPVDHLPEPDRVGAAGALAGQEERHQLGVPDQRGVGAGHHLLDPRDGLGARRRSPHRAEQVVEQLVEQVGLVPDVRVERVGRDVEPAGERAHGQRVGAVLGDQLAVAAASTAARLSPARWPGDLMSTTVRRPVKLDGVQFRSGEVVMMQGCRPPAFRTSPCRRPRRRSDQPVVVAWHLMDPPRTEAGPRGGAAAGRAGRLADLPRPAADRRPRPRGWPGAARLRGRGAEDVRAGGVRGGGGVPGGVRGAPRTSSGWAAAGSACWAVRSARWSPSRSRRPRRWTRWCW